MTKSPGRCRPRLDNTLCSAYNEYRKGHCRYAVGPKSFDQKTTAILGQGRSFSFIDLDNQTYNANDDKTKSKKPFICNHKHHPPSGK